MRHFLISDYLVCPQNEIDGIKYDEQIIPQLESYKARIKHFAEKKIPISVVSNRTLAFISKDIKLRIVYFDYGIGKVLVSATGLQKAYQLARAFQAFLTIICEIIPNEGRSNDFLIEVLRIPRYDWTDKDLASSLSVNWNFGHDSIIRTLHSGQVLFSMNLEDVSQYIEIICNYSGELYRMRR